MILNVPPWTFEIPLGAALAGAGAALGVARLARDRTFVIGKKHGS